MQDSAPVEPEGGEVHFAEGIEVGRARASSASRLWQEGRALATPSSLSSRQRGEGWGEGEALGTNERFDAPSTAPSVNRTVTAETPWARRFAEDFTPEE